MSSPHVEPESWPTNPDGELLENLEQALEGFRPYLLLIANAELDDALRAKAGASDLVQDSMIEARRDLAGFRGTTVNEFTGWLRQILRNNLANLARDFRATQKRNLAREISLDDSSRGLDRDSLPARSPSPSECAIENERLRCLERAIANLPSPFREVVQWRNLNRLPFAEIASRLNRTEKAAHHIWARAIELLQAQMTEAG